MRHYEALSEDALAVDIVLLGAPEPAEPRQSYWPRLSLPTVSSGVLFREAIGAVALGVRAKVLIARAGARSGDGGHDR